MVQESDYKYLEIVLNQAQHALDYGGSPVSAILVRDDNIVSLSYSRRDVVKGKDKEDRIHHAEFSILTQEIDNIESCTLYTTLEPCIMCMGIMMVSRVKRVVWALNDYWGGAMLSYNFDSEYVKSHLPVILAAPFLDLQTRAAAMWVEYLKRTNYEEFIDKVLGEQCKLLS